MDLTHVPTYRLFGETGLWSSIDPVHHETIAARSALHDWEITPHSHDNLLHLLFLRAGKAAMTLETQQSPLALPCLVVMPPMQVHGFRFSRDIDGDILTLPQFLLGELLRSAPELRAGFDAARQVPLAGDAEGLALMRGHFAQFAREYAGRLHGRAGALMAQLALILVWLGRRLAHPAGDAHPDRARVRMERFHDLLEAHYTEWQPVGFYAGRLGVSAAQLNNTCRQQAGHSAQQLIHERVLIEARRLLAYSGLPVTAIAYSLGFRDPAYFTRFFTRLAGTAPSSFRRQHAA